MRFAEGRPGPDAQVRAQFPAIGLNHLRVRRQPEVCLLRTVAGQKFEDVEIDEDTWSETRLWLRDDFVALDVKWEWFEILEF